MTDLHVITPITYFKPPLGWLLAIAIPLDISSTHVRHLVIVIVIIVVVMRRYLMLLEWKRQLPIFDRHATTVAIVIIIIIVNIMLHTVIVIINIMLNAIWSWCWTQASNAPLKELRIRSYFRSIRHQFRASKIELHDHHHNPMCYFLFPCEITCIEIRSAHLGLWWSSPNPTDSVRCGRIWNFVSSRHFWR